MNRSCISPLAFSTFCLEVEIVKWRGSFGYKHPRESIVWFPFVNELHQRLSQRLEREIYKTSLSSRIFKVTGTLSLKAVLGMSACIFPCQAHVQRWQTLQRYTDGTSVSPGSLVILHLFSSSNPWPRTQVNIFCILWMLFATCTKTLTFDQHSIRKQLFSLLSNKWKSCSDF